MYTITTSCSLDHVRTGKEPWICRAMLVYGRVSPTHEVIPPFTLNLSDPFGFLSLCGPQIWHPRRSCEACRNYSRSVNVCVTSARRFLEPKIVVRGCPFVLQFLGDPKNLWLCYAKPYSHRGMVLGMLKCWAPKNGHADRFWPLSQETSLHFPVFPTIAKRKHELYNHLIYIYTDHTVNN